MGCSAPQNALRPQRAPHGLPCGGPLVHAPHVRASARCSALRALLALATLTPAQAWAAPSDTAADPRAPADAAAEPSEVIAPASKPPRLSGPYLGLSLLGSVTAARVNEFGTDRPFAGGGGFVRFGQFVLPWFGLGLSVGGTGGVASAQGARQGLGQGALMVDFEFVPAPTRVRGLSLRASFGFGAGAVTEEGVSGRGGFGGAAFGAVARYTFFPGANRYRATRAGGFGIGPEIGWLGFTPAAQGRPMSNSLVAGASMTFYFGE